MTLSLINQCSLFKKYLYIYTSFFELILKNVSVHIYSMRHFAMGSIPQRFRAPGSFGRAQPKLVWAAVIDVQE